MRAPLHWIVMALALLAAGARVERAPSAPRHRLDPAPHGSRSELLSLGVPRLALPVTRGQPRRSPGPSPSTTAILPVLPLTPLHVQAAERLTVHCGPTRAAALRVHAPRAPPRGSALL